MIFSFRQIIDALDLPTSKTRLVRHDWRFLGHWHKERDIFDHEASLQGSKPNPYNGAEFLMQFVPGPRLSDGDQTAVFVTAYKVIEQRNAVGPEDRFSLWSETASGRAWQNGLVFDLEPIDQSYQFSERILVRWGPPSSTRSWSQWAERRDKEIVEFRLSAAEPGFPGFALFSSSIDELYILPSSWRAALASVKGVYLLVCPESGEQYVGSAYGDSGFWSRWSAYAADGHGGNLLLRKRKPTNYSVTILEVASPDMSASEIIARETAWKTKLGSRAHGLNAN